ncbi:MAG: sialate O-acetylesterase [Verrucomicrobiales bacterium]|nr:sialate O-acetylesterase [Verrucomicrobiales bacterium]
MPRCSLLLFFFVFLSGCILSSKDDELTEPLQGTPKTLDLFIVAGQSNAVGFDANPLELTTNPVDHRVRFWYRAGDPPPDKYDTTSGGKWTTLGPAPKGEPMPKEKGDARQYGNYSNDSGGFGPEIGFCQSILSKRPESKIAILKVAFSGTGIQTDWNPDAESDPDSCYRALVHEMKLASAAADQDGILLNLKALLWIQGESDANAQDAKHYADRLEKLITHLRQDLNSPEMTVLLAVNTQFGLGNNTYISDIVNAQKKVASSDSRTVYVDTAKAPVINTAHYSTQGTIEVGNALAKAWIKLDSRRTN